LAEASVTGRTDCNRQTPLSKINHRAVQMLLGIVRHRKDGLLLGNVDDLRFDEIKLNHITRRQLDYMRLCPGTLQLNLCSIPRIRSGDLRDVLDLQGLRLLAR